MDALLTEPVHLTGRRRVAADRMGVAREALGACEICQHRCGVDRLAGPAGRCGAGAEARVFSAQVEVGDEWEIIPAFDIALSGCNMRCGFCITGDESWHPRRGERLGAGAIAKRAEEAIASKRARSVQVLGGEPTIHLPWLMELVAAMPEEARLVLKTNGLSTAEGRDLLEGLFDVWNVDFKFGNDACAVGLSKTPGYVAAVGDTLLWAEGRVDLIVRHLVMPGHVECCWRPVAEWIAGHLPMAKVSLRSGYWPAWKAGDHPPLDRPVRMEEHAAAMEIAREFELRLVR